MFLIKKETKTAKVSKGESVLEREKERKLWRQRRGRQVHKLCLRRSGFSFAVISAVIGKLKKLPFALIQSITFVCIFINCCKKMLYKTFTFTLLLISLCSLFGSIFTQQTESPKIKKLNKIDDIINNIKPKGNAFKTIKNVYFFK